MNNEATFEARLNHQLSRVFPSIVPARLTHQDQFRIHQQVDVDGKTRDSLRGRSDIVVHLDERPVAVLVGHLSRDLGSISTSPGSHGRIAVAILRGK